MTENQHMELDWVEVYTASERAELDRIFASLKNGKEHAEDFGFAMIWLVVILGFIIVYAFQLISVPRLLWLVLGLFMSVIVLQGLIPRIRKGGCDKSLIKLFILLLFGGGVISFWLLFLPEIFAGMRHSGRRDMPQTPTAVVRNVQACFDTRQEIVKVDADAFAAQLGGSSPEQVWKIVEAYANALQNEELINVFTSSFQQSAAKRGYQVEWKTRVVRVPMIGL